MERKPAAPFPFSFELRVLEGPDAGLTVILGEEQPSLIAGTSALCRPRLADPGIAPRQFALALEGGRVRLSTLTGGPGGTRVNGVLATEAVLVGGEIVRAGDTVFSVQRIVRARGRVPAPCAFGRLRGESVRMRELFPTFVALSQSIEPLLLEGERGVGKKLLAEELHRLALRPRGVAYAPFVVASREVPEDAMTERLFGPGGLYDRARGGTLYVEDIGALDLAAQRWLAAVLRPHVRPTEAERVRVICATREPIVQGRPGRRAPIPELMSRFLPPEGARLALPPLRERHGDVSALARDFWVQLGGDGSLPDDFVAWLDRHPWPGNVRELRIAVADRIRHDGDGTIGGWLAPGRRGARRSDLMAQVIESDLPFARARDEVVAEFERRYIGRALHRADWSVSRAAEASGISPRYFRVLRGARHVGPRRLRHHPTDR